MPSSNHDEPTDRTSVRNGREADRPAGDGRARSRAGRVLDLLRLGAFWMAVFLPFAIGGVLLTGLESPAEWRLFGLLVVTSVVSLYLGHPYADQ